MTKVSGRTAFITGGANGIGLGIARALARAGAKLALSDLDSEALDIAKYELSDITQVRIYQFDVRDRDAFAAAADSVETQLGPVTLLFNNAGVIGAESLRRLTYAHWDWSLGVNLDGVINGVQTFLPRMINRNEGGHIVNTASGAGLAATNSGVLYCTAKFAVVGLSESLRVELDSLGIGVSVLCPGPVATDVILRSSKTAPEPGNPIPVEQQKRRADQKAQLNRLLQAGTPPDEVGELVLNAIFENQLYIHTDRMMEEPVKARSQAIIDAMPK